MGCDESMNLMNLGSNLGLVCTKHYSCLLHEIEWSNIAWIKDLFVLTSQNSNYLDH
jgi:hypothetical protein